MPTMIFIERKTLIDLSPIQLFSSFTHNNKIAMTPYLVGDKERATERGEMMMDFEG